MAQTTNFQRCRYLRGLSIGEDVHVVLREKPVGAVDKAAASGSQPLILDRTL